MECQASYPRWQLVLTLTTAIAWVGCTTTPARIMARGGGANVSLEISGPSSYTRQVLNRSPS